MITDKVPQIEDIEPITESEENINANYEFADGYIDPDDSLEEFLEDFRKPKEETGASEQPEEDDPELTEEEPIDGETARYTAEFIVDVSDEILAHGLALVSKNPVETHRAGKEQKKHLKKLWTQYCKEKALEIPVTTQIMLTMASIYASQLPKALSDRKTNLRLEQLEEDERRLMLDRDILRRDKENYERRKRENQ